MDAYTPFQIAAGVGLVVCALGIIYVATLAAAFSLGAERREQGIVDMAIEDPVAHETWLANEKLARLDAERADYALNAFH